jgi:uncharacterized protein (TIGR03643 family)
MLPIERDNFKDDGTDLDPQVIDRIVEMAWEDRTPFEAIEMQYGLKENQVRAIMRKHMKRSSFHMWRKRVKGRSTKHQNTRNGDINRFKSANQKG